MPSLHTIPEPSVAHRPSIEEAPARPSTGLARPAEAGGEHRHEKAEEFDEAVGVATWLIVLMFCGAALRLVLTYLGPAQASGGELGLLADQWRAALAGPGQAGVSGPAYALSAWSVHTVGLPGWVLIAIQCLAGVAAIPATYIVGHTMTGRRSAGLLAAALVALHPGMLTWSIAYHPAALAAALAAIGLAVLCHEKTRGFATAWLGALLLGIAALAAPVALIVGVAAAIWCALNSPVKRGLSLSLTVAVLGIAPALAWGQWQGGMALHTESVSPASEARTITDGWARHTAPSIASLGEGLNVDLQAHGGLMRIAQPGGVDAADGIEPVGYLGDAWMAFNALIAAASIVSLGLLLRRRRWASVAALSAAGVLLASAMLPAGEAQRLPLMVLLAVGASGFLSAAPPLRYTAEEREQRRIEKEEKNAAKLEARFARQKAKSDIYAFDRETGPASAGPAVQGGDDSPALRTRPI